MLTKYETLYLQENHIAHQMAGWGYDDPILATSKEQEAEPWEWQLQSLLSMSGAALLMLLSLCGKLKTIFL